MNGVYSQFNISVRTFQRESGERIRITAQLLDLVHLDSRFFKGGLASLSTQGFFFLVLKKILPSLYKSILKQNKLLSKAPETKRGRYNPNHNVIFG